MGSEMLLLAEKAGFSHWGEVEMSSLIAMEEVRGMCASGRCGMYGKNWSCPPHCATLERAQAKMRSYYRGVLVQTTAYLDSEFDAEAIAEAEKRHKQSFFVLTRQARLLHPGCLPLSAGCCTVCRRCTCPDRPCRFPKKRLSSMEAYGLLVSEVCRASGIKYYYGEKTLTYSSAILYNEAPEGENT